MFNICICSHDDSHHHLIDTVIRNTVNKEIEYSIEHLSSAQEVKDLSKKHSFKYHCFILHIQDESSFALVDEINDIYPHCRIIYTTDNLDFSRYISHTDFSYFIYKTDIENELPVAIHKIIHEIKSSTIMQIPLKGRTKLIELNDIVYIESHLHKVNIVCINETVECYKKLSEISESVLLYPQFLRCHNSYIVNAKYIKEFGSTSILMNNDISITITRKYKDQVKEYLTQYYNPFLKI